MHIYTEVFYSVKSLKKSLVRFSLVGRTKNKIKFKGTVNIHTAENIRNIPTYWCLFFLCRTSRFLNSAEVFQLPTSNTHITRYLFLIILFINNELKSEHLLLICLATIPSTPFICFANSVVNVLHTWWS